MHRKISKSLSILLILAMVLTNVFGYGINFNVSAEETVITVAEAIANNSGTATVEGYIVGTASSGTSYVFEAPFPTVYNLGMADDPNETDPSKIIPVQLVSGFIRTELNLQDNPENLGKKVRITGSLEAYYGVPGLKSPTDYQWVDFVETKVDNVVANPGSGMVEENTLVTLSTTTENATIYYTLDGVDPDESSTLYENPITITEDVTIKAIAYKDELDPSDISTFEYTLLDPNAVISILEARNAASGEIVIVEGIISGILGGGQNIYFQDETAGLVARLSSSTISSGWEIGDKIKVTGTMGAYANLVQVNVGSDGILDIVKAVGEPTSKIVTVDEIDSSLQGQLLKVETLIIQSAGGSGSYTVNAEDTEGRSIDLRVEGTVDGSYFETGKVVTVTSPLGQYNSSYQLMVRGESDLEEIDTSNFVSPVTATPDADLVDEGTEVVLSTSTEGATIYYTTDGSTPDESSNEYVNPIVINEDMTITAIAIKEGMENSTISTFEYSIKEVVEVTLTVSELRRLPQGSEATVGGVVIAVLGTSEVYISDRYLGMQIYSYNIKNRVTVGDFIEVTGTLGNYGGEIQFKPGSLEDVVILSSDNDIPKAVEVTLRDIENRKNAVSVEAFLENYAGDERTSTVRGIITEELRNGIYAMGIADILDPSITFNVALPEGYRGEFNIQNNPNAVGRTVLVTGQESTYYGEPAIKQEDQWDSENGVSITGKYHASYDLEGVLVENTMPFEVTGKDKYGFFIKNEEGSAYVYTGRATNFSLSDIEIGDWYTVKGIVAYYNQPQIKLIDGSDLTFEVPPGQQDPREPLVLDPSPGDYSSTYDRSPLISARVEESSITDATIDYENIKMFVNNKEVTPTIDVEKNTVSYQVVDELSLGEQDVTIHVPDSDGREKEFSWFFRVAKEEAEYNFYFGIPHAHTAYSDGAGTPTEAFEYAKANGLDFLSLSDHSNWYDGVTDGNFEYDSERNEYLEGVNPNTGEDSEWKKTRLEAEAINDKYSDVAEEDKFLAVRGFEMTSSIWGHINTINSSTYVEAKNQMVPLRDFYDWVEDVSTRPEENVFSMFNHPNWPGDSFYDLAYIPKMDRYFNGIEVANGAPPYSYSRAEGHYWKALDNGWRLGAMNAQDNHAKNWGDPSNLTVVIAESLDTDTLIDALRSRRMYATETKTLELTVKGNGHWMGSVINVNPGEEINFEVLAEDSGVDIDKLQLITNGGYVLEEKEFAGGTESAVWNPTVTAKGGAEWFVIKVIHSDGSWGHASPIFTVAGENDLKITALSVDPDPTLPGFETTLNVTVSNMGIRHVEENVEVKFYLDDPSDEANLIGTVSTEERIPSGSNVELSYKWIPPNIEGSHRIYAVMTAIDGVTTVTEMSREFGLVKPIGKKIIFDGSHSNADVPGTVVEIIEMLRLYGYEAVINNNSPITETMLENYDVLIINTPSDTSNYTEAEQEAIGNWVQNGGSIMIANKSNHGHDPRILNPLMDKIGTSIRFNNDNVYEPEGSDKYNGGMVWSVVAYNLPYAESGLNANMEAIRMFSGSSLITLNSEGNPAPLVNNPETGLEILLGGNDTSYNYNPGDDSYVYNLEGELNGEDIPMIAIENVGQGKIVAAGRHFYSDFEIGNDVSNTALTLQTIDWLAGYERIRTIKDVRDNAVDGDIVTVRGTVTAPTDHFYDVVYIQDETSGVNIYGPQSRDNLPIGTEVIVTGKVEYFEGELEIAFENYDYQVVYVGPVDEVEPTAVSTKDSMAPEYSGMLLTTYGEIVEYNETDSYFRIDDGSGVAHIHVDGYLEAGMDRFELGDYVTVTGNASVGSSGPRIRVRFYDDMELYGLNYDLEFELKDYEVQNDKFVEGSGHITLEGKAVKGVKVNIVLENEDGEEIDIERFIASPQHTTNGSGRFIVKFKLPSNIEEGTYLLRLKAYNIEKAIEFEVYENKKKNK